MKPSSTSVDYCTVFLCDYFLNDVFRRELLRVLKKMQKVLDH
jgi:hypothetical protein